MVRKNIIQIILIILLGVLSAFFYQKYLVSNNTSKKLTEKNSYDCIIALGCIIKGETDHYHYISQAVTKGIMSVTLEKTNPHIIFGVLTCQNKELAYARSGNNEKNKGYEAGMAAIHQINK